MESEPQNPEFRINPENFHPRLTHSQNRHYFMVPLRVGLDRFYCLWLAL